MRSTRASLGSIKGFVLAISTGNFAKEKKVTGNATELFLKVIVVGCGQLGHKHFERTGVSFFVFFNCDLLKDLAELLASKEKFENKN